MVDLHAHTSASDGSLSPRELVLLARQRGLSAVGVTDHDTLAGHVEAIETGNQIGVEVVPGVELSVAYEGGRFHLLGYYVDDDSDLAQKLSEIQSARDNRNAQIFANLESLGVSLEHDEVRAFCGEGGVLGRPHFARAMMARGYVSTTQEAFDRFLADDAPAYAVKSVLSPRDAIGAIHRAGGVAIWAHPARSKSLSRDQLEARLNDWVAWGLDGLETYYSEYSEEEAAWCETMRARFDLLAAGGSDFHGVSKPHIQLGVTHNGGAVPDEVLTNIKARRL